MKELSREEMLEVNGGRWSLGEVITSTAVGAGSIIGGAVASEVIAGTVVTHYAAQAIDKVYHDFKAEQAMRHHNN